MLYFLPDILLIVGFAVAGIAELAVLGFTAFFSLMAGIAFLFFVQLAFGLRILGLLVSAALFFVSVYFLLAFFSDIARAVPLSIHQLKGSALGFLLLGTVITLSLLTFVRNIRSR